MISILHQSFSLRSRGRLLEGPLSWSCALQAVENHSLLLREEGGSVLSLQAAYARLAADEGRREEKQRGSGCPLRRGGESVCLLRERERDRER